MSLPPLPFLEALEPRLAPAGIVAVDVKGGMLTLTGDAENNNVEIYDAGNGLWGIRDGMGQGTRFSLHGAPAVSVITLPAATSIRLALQQGDDLAALDGLTVTGTVTLKDTGGNDTVEIRNSQISHTVKLDLGQESNTVTAFDNTFYGPLRITGGSGYDTVSLAAGTYGSITTDLGAGPGGFFLRDITEGKAIHVHGHLSFISRAEEDARFQSAMSAEDLLITGNVNIKTGAALHSLFLGSPSDDGRVVIHGDLNYRGGSGDNSISLNGHITLHGHADFTMGQGRSSLFSSALASLSLGSLRYTGGSSLNHIEFDASHISIAGNARINLASGSDNEFQLTATDSAFISGNLTYKGGKGADSVEIVGPGSSQLAIQGRVHVDLGRGAFNEVFLHSTSFSSSVTLRSAANQDPGLVNRERITLVDSTLLGALTLKTSGTQDGIVVLNNSHFHAAVTVETGRGNDTVSLDSGDDPDGHRPLRNRFEGPVKILLGGGNDALYIGSPDAGADEGNVFNHRVLLDGGPATNIALYTPGYGNTFNRTPTVRNFEPFPG